MFNLQGTVVLNIITCHIVLIALIVDRGKQRVFYSNLIPNIDFQMKHPPSHPLTLSLTTKG